MQCSAVLPNYQRKDEVEELVTGYSCYYYILREKVISEHQGENSPQIVLKETGGIKWAGINNTKNLVQINISIQVVQSNRYKVPSIDSLFTYDIHLKI